MSIRCKGGFVGFVVFFVRIKIISDFFESIVGIENGSISQRVLLSIKGGK